MTTDALWYGGAALLAIIGVPLFLWALFWDRSRGRRRCPKCWYDMSGAIELRCSECGKRVKRERNLLKTRVRKRWAFVAVLLLISSAATTLTPKIRNEGIYSITPSTFLILSLHWTDSLDVMRELAYRTSAHIPHCNDCLDWESLYDWQWMEYSDALCRIAMESPEPECREHAIDALLGAMQFKSEKVTNRIPEMMISVLESGTDADRWQCLNSLEDSAAIYGSGADEIIAAAVALLREYAIARHPDAWFFSLEICDGSPHVQEAFVSAIVDMLGDPEYSIRMAALEVIDCGDQPLNPRLESAVRARLNDEHFLVRHAAGVVIAMMQGGESDESNDSP